MANQISSGPFHTQLTYSYRLSKNSSISLDLIRAISAQIVVVGHGISLLGIAPWLHEPRLPWMQNIAVLVFFILSGLLITYSSLRKTSREGYTFRMYFIERFSRIYTGYVPAIIFIFLLDSAFVKIHGSASFPYPLDFTTFIGNLVMLQDFPGLNKYSSLNITSLGSGRPFWTLAVEWWIYMFFGCVLFIRKLKPLIFFSLSS
jgi:peptidoglycan/LPS O-acetylase OafA/YrhL